MKDTPRQMAIQVVEQSRARRQHRERVWGAGVTLHRKRLREV